MVDKSIFIGMSGARNTMQEMEILTNNLANINTTGFRADYESVSQVPVSDAANNARIFATVGNNYTNFKQGAITSTGRDLDVAVNGDGFFAVQSKAGEEGYTRAGDFQLSKDGFLVTRSGQYVLGTSGPINIAPATKINIGRDGTISAMLVGTNEMTNIGRLKLVNPKLNNMQKGHDGLFYLTNGSTAALSEQVQVISGSIEQSNVNPVEMLTKLIDISRHYDLQMNMMKNYADNASKGNQLLEII